MDWKYANVTSTQEWRSAMTLPQGLKLNSSKSGIRLIQTSVVELEWLHENKKIGENKVICQNDFNLLSEINGKISGS